MALSKKEHFQKEDTQLADWCKALGHPARIAILKTLAEKNNCICGELVLDLPLAQSTISQHLKALKEIGLIQGEVDGPRSKYCINRKNFALFLSLLDHFSNRIESDLENIKCEGKEI